MQNLDLIKKAVEDAMQEADLRELQELNLQYSQDQQQLDDDLEAINDFLETC